jgi:phage/conjugal plasmid C-4 type zinc finger TraR family protein
MADLYLTIVINESNCGALGNYSGDFTGNVLTISTGHYRMYDMIAALKDKSGEPEDIFVGAAVEAEVEHVRRQMAEQRSRGPSLEFCEDCDEDIPAKRQELVPGCTRCVRCEERYGKLRLPKRGMTMTSAE